MFTQFQISDRLPIGGVVILESIHKSGKISTVMSKELAEFLVDAGNLHVRKLERDAAVNFNEKPESD